MQINVITYLLFAAVVPFVIVVEAQKWHGHRLPERARGGIAAALLEPGLFDVSVGNMERNKIDLPLDHFHGDENKEHSGRTFSNYFITNDQYYNGSGPIFVQMGGEGPVSSCYTSEIHKKHNALALCVEHRFYGISVPKLDDGSIDRSVETLRFLSVEQNLADTAAIVEHVQTQQPSRRPVVNFGGSYSGATAAWFRQAYPNVTMAASSSSGVVKALLNFTGFDATVAEAIGPACSRRMQVVTDVFVRALEADDDGVRWNDAKRQMRAENLVETPLGDDDFFYALADAAQMMDQYGHKRILCDGLETFIGDAQKRSPSSSSFPPPLSADRAIIGNFSDLIANVWGKAFMGGCFYDSECVRNASSAGMARSWRWQKCTELAYLQPGYRGSLRYEKLSLERLLDQCAYVFPGITLPPNTEGFNHIWGGARPTGTRVFFADYSDDPWRFVSVQSQLSSSQPYCYLECDGCGHCGSGVPANLTKCDDEERRYVDAWLRENGDAWVRATSAISSNGRLRPWWRGAYS